MHCDPRATLSTSPAGQRSSCRPFPRFPAIMAPQRADNRYVLWAFSRYSQGDKPSTFIQPPKPPKKFRG